jgi:hypothetical protein
MSPREILGDTYAYIVCNILSAVFQPIRLALGHPRIPQSSESLDELN